MSLKIADNSLLVNTVEEKYGNISLEERISEIEELHRKTISQLKEFSTLSIDLNLCFDILKENMEKLNISEINEEDEGDYNLLYEMLSNKLNLDYEQRINKFSTTFWNEITKCTKIIRYTLKNLMNNNSSAAFSGIAIDIIWKIMLINMETLLEHEGRMQRNSENEIKKNTLFAQERYKEAISRLKFKEKEMELELTLKKEECDAKVISLIDDKNKLQEILNFNNLQIEDLMDPSRFVHMHYFLAEFKNHFEANYEANLNKLKITNNILQILMSNDNKAKELNDELSTTDLYFPKYTIVIMRKLEEQLGITEDEIKRKLKNVQKELKSLLNGSYKFNQLVHIQVQTNSLKELEKIHKVTLTLFFSLRKN